MGRHRHVFVLIDALGWPCVEEHGFLSDVLPYRTPVRTILGYSSGAIPSLLTGRLPTEHGHWNLFYYDPQRSPFRWLRRLQFLPDGMLDHRVTRKLLKELGRRLLGLGPLFECGVSPRVLPWFDWIEKRNIYARGGISGAPSIFDRLAAHEVPHRVYSYHDGRDEALLRRALADIRSGEERFFFLYLSELDAFLHGHCDDPTRIAARLAWYDARLREVFRALRAQDPEAGFTLASDHGMTLVRRHVDLVAEVQALGLQMPTDYLAVYDSTMARFWFFSHRAREAVLARLADLPYGRILPEAELRELGVWFADGRFGEVVFLLDPGVLVASGDFNGRGWNPVGMHGYHPDDAYSDAILLGDRAPAVPVRTITDLYAHMLAAAGVAP